MVEWTAPVILGRNDNLSTSVGESDLFVDDYANESVRELFGRIVRNRNVLYDDAPLSIDVHKQLPRVNVMEYHSQAIRIEFKFLDVLRCDEQVPVVVLEKIG